MAAVEQAENEGFKGIDWQPMKIYQWGSNIGKLEDARPGDIVQWKTYSEKVDDGDGMSRESIMGINHTSIVAERYLSRPDGGGRRWWDVKCWGQTPRDPVSLKVYQPACKTGGSLSSSTVFVVFLEACVWAFLMFSETLNILFSNSLSVPDILVIHVILVRLGKIFQDRLPRLSA